MGDISGLRRKKNEIFLGIRRNSAGAGGGDFDKKAEKGRGHQALYPVARRRGENE